MALNIGKVQLKNPFFMAPLAGITDSVFRKICQDMGASLTYSEMVSAKGLYYGDKNTEKLLALSPGEENVAYQIFGHEPYVMEFAGKELESRPNVILDINMGCPVNKVVKNLEGSYLMKNPKEAFNVVDALVKSTSKPVTVKIRSGWDEDHINALEVALAVEAAGAAAVAVHPRTREQFYSGRADWSVIKKVKSALTIPVIGNGDVVDFKSCSELMETTNCDFVMIGRGALGNPWIFRELVQWYRGENITKAITLDEKKEMMIHHLNGLVEIKGEYIAIREMRKHVGWYLKGEKGAAKLRGAVNQINTYDELIKIIKGL